MAALEEDLTILVIEDNPGDFVLIQEYLLDKTDQPEIVHAKTYAEAEKHVTATNRFDAILLDLSLPDASGESLVKKVVELSGAIPVIVLTGYENEQFGLKTLGMGVADYLLKDELNPFLLYKSISYSIERNRINQSLRESEKQYRNLFNLSPLPKWVYDAESLAFLDVNKRAIDHYGYSREEFLSMTIKDIRPDEHIPILEETLENSLNVDGIYESGIHTHTKKNGQVIQVDLRSTLITYHNRKAKMVVAEDVTDRLETEKQLALSEKRFRSLVQGGADFIAILDDQSNYKYLSPSYQAVLGMEPDNYVGTCANDFVHEDDLQRILNAAKELAPNERTELKPYRFKHSDGSWRWVESTITNMLNNPAVEGIVVNSRDVTESIQREQKLQNSLELYEYVTKATDDIVYDWDLKEDILYWDDSFHDKFIYDIEEGTYSIDYWAQNVHPDDLPETEKSLNEILQSSKSKWEQEYRFKKQDGTYATVFERGFIIRDKNGDAIRMIGSLQDITERKEYEEKLEELALVASKTTDVIFMTDPNEKITWINNAFEDVLGYQFNEVIGKAPGNIITGPDNNPQRMNRISKAFRKQKPLQEVVLNYSKAGEKYWFDLTLDPIFDSEGNCEGFIGIQKDVTEQIEHQRELRESVERYESVSKATSDTVWDLDLENDTVQYNQNIYNMFGYDKQEVKEPAQWWRDKLHPDDRENILQQMDGALESEKDRFQMEYRFQCADGSYKYIYDRAFIVNDNDGQPIRMIGAMQDVSQQREERKWLKLFESAIASTKESVAIIEGQASNPPGRDILYVNDAFSSMTGYSKEESKGNTLHILNGPKTDKKERQKLGERMARWNSCDAELINYKKSGDEFWIRVSMTPVQGPENTSYWVCVGRDITERKKNENELRESLKEKETLLLEIHHRVKNNLAVVSGMMQLQAFDEDNKLFKEKLFDSVTRIQTMGSIHELLYQSESFSELSFDDNLKKLVQDVSDTFQTDFELNVQFDMDPINLNINQAIPCSLIVNEVITNIFKHAFGEGDSGTVLIKVKEKKQSLVLSVEDNGKGLPPNFGQAITNKTLGLKLIDTLAEQLEADYSYNALNNGARFNLSFDKAKVKGIGSAHIM